MNILFMGTPDIARDSLEALVENGHNIVGVVTVPDKPNSRGNKIIYSPVKEFAMQKGFKIYQPETLSKNEEFLEEVKKLNPDIICIVAYGKYVPKAYINLCKYEPVNVHPSLLPKYRGASPIQWAVLNGDKETGCTTMYISPKMDAGDIILQEKVEIGEYETTGELWDRLSKLGAKLLVETLSRIEDGSANRQPQGDEYTETTMITKDMAKINWNELTSEKLNNLVRGLNPFLGAYSLLNGKKYKLWKIRIENTESVKDFISSEELKKATAGEIVFSDSKKGLYIKTIDGIISVLEIQGENAKRMGILDFLRGNNFEINTKFE